MKNVINIGDKIRGVTSRPRSVELCIDPDFRDRLEDCIARIQAAGARETEVDGEESLADTDPRTALLEELDQIRREADEADAWMKFSLRQPSHAAKLAHMAAVATMNGRAVQGEDGQIEFQQVPPDEQAKIMLDAEIGLLVSSVLSIDGETRKLTEDEARYILTEWDDDLSRELVETINSFSAEGASIPFSQRVSAILATQTR